MYYVTCDGYPLLDWRDNDLILVNPKVKLEVNTVGEGSFTIYKNHPYYDKLKKLKSVFEVSDENSVIFRGRATGDTIDFDHGMAVDLEGAMAFFNDSVVRPFSFPSDFEEDADYITAAESGNVIAFFLGWLIDNHNSQVQDFQKMKLGNVTVTDPNNYITRSNSNYASTWGTLKAKLFDSSLGGYLCIRYEEDGNYIDYLSDFTETNSQRVEFGENLLDLTNQTEASETYSAIIPIGAAGLTIEGLDDGDITDDLVKSGDTIYSKSAVEAYGWIYAPTSETTWDDVTDDRNLRTKGAEWLANGGASVLKAIEATAVDLHFTTEQAESLRIYKNVEVYSEPHGISEIFPLSKLEIDLLNPQNTKARVGKTLMSLTERTAIQDDEVLTLYSKITKTDEEIRIFVADEINNLSSSFSVSLNSIRAEVTGVEEEISYIELDLESITSRVQDAEGNIATLEQTATSLRSEISGKLDGEDVQSLIDQSLDEITLAVTDNNGTVSIQLKSGDDDLGTAGTIDMTGLVTFSALSGEPGEGQTKINGGWIDADTLTVKAAKIVGEDDETLVEIVEGVVDADYIYALGITATELRGYTISLVDEDADEIGGIDLYFYDQKETIDIHSNEVLWLTGGSTAVMMYGDFKEWVAVSADGVTVSNDLSSVYSGLLGLSTMPWDTLFADSCSCCTSDEKKKNSIEELPEKYLTMFDNLQPKRFKMNNGKSSRYHPGYIAQDVKAAMDAAGIDSAEFGGWIKDEDKDGNEIYMLRYEEFGAIYAAKIKQLEARVAELEVKQNG